MFALPVGCDGWFRVFECLMIDKGVRIETFEGSHFSHVSICLQHCGMLFEHLINTNGRCGADLSYPVTTVIVIVISDQSSTKPLSNIPRKCYILPALTSAP